MIEKLRFDEHELLRIQIFGHQTSCLSIDPIVGEAIEKSRRELMKEIFV